MYSTEKTHLVLLHSLSQNSLHSKKSYNSLQIISKLQSCTNKLHRSVLYLMCFLLQLVFILWPKTNNSVFVRKIIFNLKLILTK